MAVLSLYTLSLLIFLFSSAAAVDYGFTVELIHRDSPNSPLFNTSETHYHRLTNALRRSISRHAAVDTAEAPMYNNRGEYLMKLSLGTPPFPIMAIADTGSDIVWSQCAPCTRCYRQSAPMFDPSKSATYKQILCSSSMCPFSRTASCPVQSDECEYSINYGDGSHSRGDIAVDTVTLGSTSGRPVAFPRTVFGCGRDSAGTFNANVSGIVGLGHGAVSLVSQMGPSIAGKFSYCLAPIGSNSIHSSKLSFGSNAVVAGAGTVSTPIYTDDGPFYRLKLEAISVGGNKINFPSASPSPGDANIIIDSGTTVTLLPPDFYAAFGTSVSDGIYLQRVRDPNQFLDFCFQSTADDFDAPPITVHFEGGDVKLSRENVFIRMAADVVCLAFISAPQNGGVSIYGNILQTNFLIGYDTQKMAVSFRPADCAAM